MTSTRHTRTAFIAADDFPAYRRRIIRAGSVIRPIRTRRQRVRRDDPHPWQCLMTATMPGAHACGAYPRVTGCPWCGGSARWESWGDMQGARYVCGSAGCGRPSVSLDWCECECAARVDYTPGARYPYRPACECGWSYGRGYVADHAARIIADAHAAGSL